MILQHRVPDGQTVTAAYYSKVIVFRVSFKICSATFFFLLNGQGTDVTVSKCLNMHHFHSRPSHFVIARCFFRS